MTAKIAIVGTEACGKSVFTACLANKYEHKDANGWWMDPQDFKTKKFVGDSMSILHSGDWLAETAAGTHFSYAWKLKGPQVEYNLHVVDAPGHDIRALFATDALREGRELPGTKLLAEYCLKADIVLLLINLKDYIGIANADRRMENEWAPQAVLKLIHQRPHVRCAIVLTQIDIYKQYMHEQGGPEQLLAKILPAVHQGYIADKRVPVFGVSAVDKTDVVVRDGRSGCVPALGFKSIGFEPIMEWIAKFSGDAITRIDEFNEQIAERERKIYALRMRQEKLKKTFL